MSSKYWFVFVMLLAQSALAEEEPKWSFEFKGGRFESAETQWSDYYGNDHFPEYALALGYKLNRQIEVGIEAGYLADEGHGLAPAHGIPAGDLKYRLYPAHLHLTARGIFRPDQWLVPYLGAAWSRYSYRVETERQPDITGATDGYQYRAGVQLLLDNLDKSAASDIESNFGIVNTYLVLEAQRTEVSIDGTDLGGTAYLGGLLFEF